MGEIQFLCLIMIAVEVYHFFYHNRVYATCKPVYDRVKFVNYYGRMLAGYYSMEIFARNHPQNKTISQFMRENELLLDRVHDGITFMPSSTFTMQRFMNSVKPRALVTVIVSNIIEIVYFALFIRLALILPMAVSIRLVVAMVILSVIHALNERGDKIIWVWWPILDAATCAVIYGAIFFMFGSVIS